MNLGDISFNGEESKIYGEGFSITPTQASFYNINASGKITTAVFEANHVQAVGGAMIFKPSYKIKQINGNKIILEEDFLDQDFKYDSTNPHYIYLVDKDGQIASGEYELEEVNKNEITLTNPITGEYSILIDIGPDNSLVIGINSNDGANSFLRPRGMTISTFKHDNVLTSPKVFLGDLDSSGIDFGSSGNKGYGLYSENVYLTGSLTTKLESGNNSTYAGVNTLNGANAQVFDQIDNSKIVFWAGSTDTTNQSIQKAPFQVTEQGSLYASRGTFEGAIITKSTIQGVDIYAARIHGNGKNNNLGYGLAFYDASDGIVFNRGDYDPTPTAVNSNITEVFTIGTDGLKTNNKYFIKIGDKVTFTPDYIYSSEYYTDITKSRCIHLKDSSINCSSFINDNDVEEIFGSIDFSQDSISMGLNKENNNIIITNGRSNLNTQEVHFMNTVLFAEQMKYEKVSSGYNLYVL